jgi:hypothetical protein
VTQPSPKPVPPGIAHLDFEPVCGYGRGCKEPAAGSWVFTCPRDESHRTVLVMCAAHRDHIGGLIPRWYRTGVMSCQACMQDNRSYRVARLAAWSILP